MKPSYRYILCFVATSPVIYLHLIFRILEGVDIFWVSANLHETVQENSIDQNLL